MAGALWAHRPYSSRNHAGLVRIGLSLATTLLLIALAATSVGAFTVERASVASDGTESTMSSSAPAVSANGRFVAFVSASANLVASDTNGQLDVFVHDRATGATERASVSSSGAQATGQSATPALSADGRFVAFASPAANLVTGDTNGRFDIFVRDRQTQTTERVSLAADGSESNSDSVSPAISADGRYVAFASAAPLVADDLNDSFDIYVRDRVNQTTTRVSVGPGGVEGNNLSLAPRISGDGSVVVFHSFASNLVAGDTNNVPDVFAYERATGVTTRMSVSSSGTQGNQQSVAAAVSADGRYVAFDSDASTLVSGDVNGRTDVFVHDRVTGTTERASVSSSGGEGNNRSGFVDAPTLSADGRYVAFTSGASNLVPDDGNNVVDVMLRDRVAHLTVRVNVAADGTEADGSSTLSASMAGDGSVVVFASSADNLVANDGNFVADIFAYVDTCGNGALDVGETCDDGNREDGDCCSATCTVEPAGSTCDDGDLCTQSDTCDASGACVGADPVVCAAGGTGACSSSSSCDPATGACVGGPSPDGTACDDGDPCTVEDTCLDGVCEPGDVDPAACVSSFQCYDARTRQHGKWWKAKPKVLVEDRFEAVTFRFGITTEVCAATTSPPGQSARRLACVNLHRASGSERSRTVKVRNALGELTLTVGRAKEMCLPAGATQAPADPGLDAFKCYSADTKQRTPRFKQVTLNLSDEFGSGKVDVLGPELLCNPASVAGGGVEHEVVHLLCYQIQDHWVWGWHQDFFRPRNASVAHAFGSDQVTLIGRDHLCVPSVVVP